MEPALKKTCVFGLMKINHVQKLYVKFSEIACGLPFLCYKPFVSQLPQKEPRVSQLTVLQRQPVLNVPFTNVCFTYTTYVITHKKICLYICI